MNRFFLGLDLGQASDYTALCVLERLVPQSKDRQRSDYHVRHLERLALGTSYPAQVAQVKALMGRAPLKDNTALVVDGTGVGRPVVDMLRREELQPIAISIHGGDAVTKVSAMEYRVPKRDLVGSVQAALQNKQLKFASGLALRDVLQHEMQNFRAKINVATGHDSYEAWREGDHDDCVLALACALWFASTQSPTWLVY